MCHRIGRVWFEFTVVVIGVAASSERALIEPRHAVWGGADDTHADLARTQTHAHVNTHTNTRALSDIFAFAWPFFVL